MIEIFRWRKPKEHGKVIGEAKWRIKIVNETLEFDTKASFDKHIQMITKLKEDFEPSQ